MFYSLDDLRLGARFKSDQYQTQRIQNDELDGYINDAIDEAQSIIWPLNEGYFVKEAYRDIVAGQREYLLPEDAKAIVGIDISTDGGMNYYEMQEKNIDRRNLNNNTTAMRTLNGYYYKDNKLVLVSTPSYNSTNGLKILYIKEHYDLTDDSVYIVSVSGASRTNGIATITTSSAHNVENGQLITLKSMTEDSFNGTFRVLSILSDVSLTCSQEGLPDYTGGGVTGSLYRRYGLDMPGGKTVKRYIEAWAVRAILQRDGKPTNIIDDEIKLLENRIKHNLNYRTRGKTRKIRMKNLYSTAISTPYVRRQWR